MSWTLQPPPPPPPMPLMGRNWAYLVAFRLTGPPAAYQDFFHQLKSYDNWFNYTPNFWIIVTRKALLTVAGELRPRIRTVDWLIVMPAKGPADGWLPEAGWNWLQANLPSEW